MAIGPSLDHWKHYHYGMAVIGIDIIWSLRYIQWAYDYTDLDNIGWFCLTSLSSFWETWLNGDTQWVYLVAWVVDIDYGWHPPWS